MAVSHREKNAAYVESEGEDGDEDEEVEKEDPEAKARAERSEMAQLRRSNFSSFKATTTLSSSS